MTQPDDADDRHSRRRFLGLAAAVGTATMAGCAGQNSGGGATTESTTTTAAPEPAPDVPLLNYALTLEHLENAFYREGLETFSDEEVMGADALS